MALDKPLSFEEARQMKREALDDIKRVARNARGGSMPAEIELNLDRMSAASLRWLATLVVDLNAERFEKVSGQPRIEDGVEFIRNVLPGLLERVVISCIEAKIFNWRAHFILPEREAQGRRSREGKGSIMSAQPRPTETLEHLREQIPCSENWRLRRAQVARALVDSEDAGDRLFVLRTVANEPITEADKLRINAGMGLWQ